MKDSKVYVIKRQMQQLRAWCALQLADFLALRIDKAGGMMPLPDVYCLFNRARGAELISPDDLLTAAKLLFTGSTSALLQTDSGLSEAVMQLRGSCLAHRMSPDHSMRCTCRSPARIQ